MKLQKTVRIFADKHLENLGNVFESLYKDSLLTDCVLYCKDGAIKAHKVILAASSRYFRQVFIDHADDNAIFMYGISYSQLKNLVELIYRGCIEVPGDSFNSLYTLVEDLKVTGVVVDATTDTKSNGIGRDTRYKGQKRVAVDFEVNDDGRTTSTPKIPNPYPTDTRRHSSSSESASPKKGVVQTEGSPKVPQLVQNFNSSSLESVPAKKGNDSPCALLTPKQEPNPSVIDIDSINENDNFIGHEVTDEHGEPLSIWAKKERKFKCNLCPSSFKRASHLSRHQLVHTGERPFACDQCEKAFSRHDKLKHHIHKTHEIGALNEALGPDSLYTIDHVDILTPETNMVESASTILTQHHSEQNMSSVSSVSSTDFGEPPQKKGRGRPRKYPPVPKPLVKRPRGRPRINPLVARPHVKRPRGRPRMSSMGSYGHCHGYESYHSNSFGDISYLYKSDHSNNTHLDESSEIPDNNSEMENESRLHEQGFMEPLVEIKTEAIEKPPTEEERRQTATSSFFENIGLFEKNTAIAKIGECTISVAASCTTNISNPTNNIEPDVNH